MQSRSIKPDLLLTGGLILVAALARIPYVALIPLFEDEVTETVFALSIQPGKFMPLTGIDPYAAPLFTYLLAIFLRVLGPTPAAPRIIIMVMGVLTVAATYWLARAVGLRRPWAALAGLLLAANPLHILVNSHYAGTSYTIPLFATLFIAALITAVRKESGGWLVASGALLGLAVSNPVLALVLPGVGVWFLVQVRSKIGLRTRWPYLAALAFLLVYSPVIIYNLTTELAGVAVVGGKHSYLWQPTPSLPAFAINLGRLALQLSRQVSGVLEGGDTPRALVGLPLLLVAWAIAGIVYGAWAESREGRRGLGLPAFAVASQLVIMPWVSDHYGMTGATRFTNQLTPLAFVAMTALAERAWEWAHARIKGPLLARSAPYMVGVLLVAVAVWPLQGLFLYYDHRVSTDETNALYYAFSDEFLRQWQGEKVFMSARDWYSVAEYFLAVENVPHERMPVGRMLERLATGQESGRVTLILYNEDVRQATPQADLVAWTSPAIRSSIQKLGYGVYTIPDARLVRKPPFVVRGMPDEPEIRSVEASLDGKLSMVGYSLPQRHARRGGRATVIIFWKAIGSMDDAYIGFVHLVGPQGRLAAQDDHELGRGFYRTSAWQPGEVIREKYLLDVPEDAPPGEYVIGVGAYAFPSLKRLRVDSTSVPEQDNIVTFATLDDKP